MTTETEKKIDLNELEAIARAATPGPWQVITDEHETYAKSYVHKERRIFTNGIDPQLGDIYPVVNSSRGIAAEKGDPPIWMVSMEQQNADYIAAANPATVLALIAMAREVWIDLKDHKPEEGKRVLIALETRAVVTGFRFSAGWHWDDTDDLSDGDAAATHWKIMPEAPRKGVAP